MDVHAAQPAADSADLGQSLGRSSEATPMGGGSRVGEWRLRLGSLSTPTLYLLMAIPMTLFVVLFIPPSQGIDESAHWFRTWEIAEFNLVSERTSEGDPAQVYDSGTYPECVRSYVDRFQEIATAGGEFSWGSFWQSVGSCSADRHVNGEAMGTYSIWAYPGQVAGVAIGRLLNLPVFVTFYLGRLVAAVLGLLGCWYSIRQAPRGREALAFIALLPMSIAGMSTYSPDGVVFVGALILISSAIRYSSPTFVPGRRDMIVISLALMAMALTKPPYLLLAAVLALYARPVPTLIRRWMIWALGTTLAAVAAWTLFGGAAPDTAALYYPTADPGRQIEWILRHPLAYANTLWDSIVSNQQFVLEGWVGAFGMFRNGGTGSPLMMPMYTLVAVAALVVLICNEWGMRSALMRTSPGLLMWRSLPVLLVLLLLVAIYTGLYVLCSEVAAPLVWGVQGRYLLPILPLLPLAVVVNRAQLGSLPVRSTLVLSSTAIFIGAIHKLVVHFY